MEKLMLNWQDLIEFIGVSKLTLQNWRKAGHIGGADHCRSLLIPWLGRPFLFAKM
jgi:hypothetical protein